jgi:hypothetical protein
MTASLTEGAIASLIILGTVGLCGVLVLADRRWSDK